LATEEQHVALPKLYGAPAYARPPKQAAGTPRPLDPDDLPITALQTEDERELLDSLPARAYASGGGVMLGQRDAANGHRDDDFLRPRAFRLRALAGRFLGGDS
jgi:hypothetical protein